jgi:histone deacetylase 11
MLFIMRFPIFASGSNPPSPDSLPIIYSPDYNMSVLGIEHFHPFDTKKYAKAYRYLIEQKAVQLEQIYSPSRPSDEELLLVHTPEYLASIRHSSTIAKIVEIPALRFIPAPILRHGILEPMRLATGGTILGARLALRYGWAINLSGGYHHAKADKGSGFCVFADVPIAIRALWKEHPDLKVLIVDLDAHQGNGNSTILGNDPRVAIFDMYNGEIFPGDIEAQAGVKYKVPLQSHTGTLAYLDSLKQRLPQAIEEHAPGLIVYNAGTDVFVGDPLGNLSITEQGIIDRDNYVMSTAFAKKTPILMVLSGGYTKKSGAIIGKSITSFLESRHK